MSGVYGTDHPPYPAELDYKVAGMVYLDPFFETDEYPSPAEYLFVPVAWEYYSIWPGDMMAGSTVRFMEDGQMVASVYERANDPMADDDVHSRHCECVICHPLVHGDGCKCFTCTCSPLAEELHAMVKPLVEEYLKQ